MKQIELGKIEDTFLGYEDHDIFTFWLYLDFGGSVQGFGGYGLDTPKHDENKKFIGRFGTATGMGVIISILKAVGVNKWEDLPGKVIWIKRENEGWNSSIIAIKAPDFVKGTEWFDIKEHFKNCEE
jgi:hypothetical protein